MAQQLLAQPVEFGDVQLAPTTELCALAELSTAEDPAERIAILARTAEALRSEDAVRAEMSQVRAAISRGNVVALPQRR